MKLTASKEFVPFFTVSFPSWKIEIHRFEIGRMLLIEKLLNQVQQLA